METVLTTDGKVYTNVLKGLVACMADTVISGTAYVLLDFEKADQFPKGFILVTEQTSPECTSAIENSVAVITERGGILCHAAIVSRDMNIPCIVGVKGLLSRIQSGMQIALDTDTGTIYY